MDEQEQRIHKRLEEAVIAAQQPETPRREKDLHRAYIEDVGYLLKRVQEVQGVADFMVDR